MMHRARPHQVATVETIEELHDKLARFSWVLCTGFRWRSILLLNDSTSEDALQEYAVIKLYPYRDDRGMQVDSLTVSWISLDNLRAFLEKADAEEYGASAYSYGPWAQRPHGDGKVCRRCA